MKRTMFCKVTYTMPGFKWTFTTSVRKSDLSRTLADLQSQGAAILCVEDC